jgi:hypothetical protein
MIEIWLVDTFTTWICLDTSDFRGVSGVIPVVSGAIPVVSGQIRSFSKVFRSWEEVGIALV